MQVDRSVSIETTSDSDSKASPRAVGKCSSLELNSILRLCILNSLLCSSSVPQE